MQPYVELLKNLQSAPLGKFAVCGNHEFYADIDACLDLTREAGFGTRNKSVSLNDELTLIGMDDPTTRRNTSREKVDDATFKNVDPSTFRLFSITGLAFGPIDSINSICNYPAIPMADRFSLSTISIRSSIGLSQG